MPKIFLIKNRLHQQQLKLLESQNLLAAKNDLGLGDRDEDDSRSGDGQNEPLSLVSRNRERDNHDSGKLFVQNTQKIFRQFFSSFPTRQRLIFGSFARFSLSSYNQSSECSRVCTFFSFCECFFGAEVSLVLRE